MLKSECTVINHYGPTETTVGVLTYRLEKDSVSPYAATPPLGRPIHNLRVYILDSQLRVVPVGLPGELFIGGTGVARGYLNQPNATAEKFLPDPYNPESGSRMYQTGDLARFLPDGTVEFLGRLDNQVKIRGYRVELGEIEQTLRQLPGIDTALVLPRPDQLGELRLIAYLLAEREYLAKYAQSLYAQQLEEWKQVFNETHRQLEVRAEATFNPFGWNSSYTGEPMPEEEIREQVNYIVQNVLELKPSRVLEIGCGTGLLLFPIAPYCEEYWGTDFSPEILGYTRKVLESTDIKPERVKLLERTAEDLEDLPAQRFDLVILNSVIQYFPGVDYLLQVLQKTVRLVKNGGYILLGDVRNLALLEAFHASVQLQKAQPDLRLEQLAQLVKQQLERESELILEPSFFYALPQYIPELSGVEIRLKKGYFQNELNKFRYDVFLRVKGETIPETAVIWHNWTEEHLTSDNLHSLLAQTKEAMGFNHIPNGRVVSDYRLVGLLKEHAEPDTIEGLLENLAQAENIGVDPENIRSMGKEFSRPVSLSWSEKPDCFDAIFFEPESSATRPVKGQNRHIPANLLEIFANSPIQPKLLREWLPRLRASLGELLPDYMLPTNYVVLRELPLTPNGKIDFEALPEPDLSRPESERPFVAPRNAVEEVVASIWSEILRFDRIGVNDNFFELGGHSLLATQVVSRLGSIFQVRMPLRSFFEMPTVAGIARSLLTMEQSTGQIQKIAEIWQRINKMSGEEVRDLLQQHTNKPE
jgi:ubiquinone/menaquinone biosynthesis C-methylase UbiE/acyl carrier protein